MNLFTLSQDNTSCASDWWQYK